MKKKTVIRVGLICLSPLVLAALVFVGFITFQYTLVADARELFSEVEKGDTVEYGRTLFETRGCFGCHGTGSETPLRFGPNLGGIADRQSIDYLRESIISPNAVIALRPNGNSFPADSMPEYGKILDDEQIGALVAFLSTL